ncbi:hypothetical protein N8I77_002051 [Diaporthe amygdali]|uniref:Uncharacterized protein n=1 Tax=Phomopsis amygdali TaxID=1214568 RepID=A0AAD9WAS5_PHOAM|nr:hypothetical protein N8I77_002051 [Diaporthe amygdali]
MPSVPDEETIDHLLGRRNNFDRRTKSIKTIEELSEKERNQVHLVTLGKRQTRIEGDPFGIYPAWAGNVGHPRDDRMIRQTDEVRKLSALFEAVRRECCEALALHFADNAKVTSLSEDENELTFTFKTGGLSVRVMQAKDLEQDEQGSYLASLEKSKRCIQAKEHLDELFKDVSLNVLTQQYVMAQVLLEDGRQWPSVSKDQTEFLTRLRADADGRYWIEMSEDERKRTNAASATPHSSLALLMTRLQQNWPRSWNLGYHDPDMFRRYARDQVAIEKVWKLVEEDVLIVLDRSKKLVFSNFVGLSQVLFNQEVVDLLARGLDMWSFYTPLPAPESKRHSVDHYIRKIHPELDMEKATVAGLPNAKKAVVHYGTYAMAGHTDGRRICLTQDSKFARSSYQENNEALFLQLYSSVFGKAASIIRFMMEKLDREHYQECRDIFRKLPKSVKVSTGDRDFLSLFAVGINLYTQRHRDTNDMRGGLASLLTVGNYQGGDLCLPQLGLKVRYTPGTCALMRGDSLEHLTSDFTGFRAFIVGANHETTRLHVRLREQGAAGLHPPLSTERPRAGGGNNASEDSDSESEGGSEIFTTTCVNDMDDEDDEDVTYTNKELHGAGALDSESSSGG